MNQSRGEYIWGNILIAREKTGVSLERAKLITASWKETDGQPYTVRRGKAIEKILGSIPLYIDDEQLLVGNFSSKSMWAEWYPEFESKFVLNSRDYEPALRVFNAQGADTDEIQELAEYWKDKSIEDMFLEYSTPEQIAEWTDMGEDGAFVFSWLNQRSRHSGYFCVDYAKAIGKGFTGILADIDAEIKATHIHDDESLRKVNLLKGYAISLRAGIVYAKRFAALAREMAAGTADERRKAELLKISEVCEWVPENPARSFWEALQTVLFCHVFIYLEMRGDGVSPGRVDQYLYPYYIGDVGAGNLTEDQAIDLLQCFRIKFNTFRQFSSKRFFEGTSGEAQFHNVTLAGTTADGKDAVNELSFLFLEAAQRLKTPHPTLSVRYHEGISEAFMQKALKVVATGGGYPAFFNDKSNIQFLTDLGISLEESRGYAIGGCVVAQIPGKTGPGYPVVMNMSKCLELALHDGFDPFATKKQIGPHTGKLEDFKTFDDLMEAFKKQIVYVCDTATTLANMQRCFRELMMPSAFTDVLIDDCIHRGKSSLGEGSRYQIQYQNARCMINAVDSLAAVKKCVFEDGSVGRKELEDALLNNFEGYEKVQKLLLAAPKYGNDEEFVDSIANDIYVWWGNMVKGTDAGFGANYVPGAYSVGAHNIAGARTGALPSGRVAGAPLADGSISPAQGFDVNGPTAVINSSDRIDQTDFSCTLLNMKFQSSVLKTDEDRKKLSALIAAYFDGSGKHVQFNIVDRKTLLDAQARPENYRNLLVRVAGYSAFFIELMPNLQNEIIKRTEHAL